MRIEQIIVTGASFTSMEKAVERAHELFDCSPRIVPLCGAKYCSFTVPPDNDDIDRTQQRIEFCRYLEENHKDLSFVWLECVVDALNRKGKDEDRIICSNNWDLDY